MLRERSYKTKQFLPHAEVCDHPLKLGHGFLVSNLEICISFCARTRKVNMAFVLCRLLSREM